MVITDEQGSLGGGAAISVHSWIGGIASGDAASD